MASDLKEWLNRPREPLAPAHETPAGPDDDDEDQGDAGDDSADDAPADDSWRAPARAPSGRGFQPVTDGAGWVLGLLLWGWVGMPFLKGGPAQVKKVWMAKFFNKAPDGSFLP
jgi:hypothetical protein